MRHPETILVGRDGPIAQLTLNRPEIRNALNPLMIREIGEAFDVFSDDDEIRVVVIDGAGPAFCAGGDLNWMRDVLGMSKAEVETDSRNLLEMYRAIDLCPKLVICRVHGAAFAGATGILAASDIVIARRNTQFRISEVRLGLLPGLIAALIVPRAGVHWFRYLAKSAVLFEGETARLAGLVHELVDDDEELDARVSAHVALALEASPEAIAGTGELIAAIGSGGDDLEVGLSFNARSRMSAESQEGISAFLEKRRPNWTIDRE